MDEQVDRETGIDQVLRIEEGEVVTRWALVGEVYDLNDNTKQLELVRSEGMEDWDVEAFMRRGIDLAYEEDD